MKTKQLFIPFIGIIAFLGSCKEKEKFYEDSPLITVKSPAKNQVIEDTDSVRVQAVIENKSASLKNVSVWLLDNNKQYIYNQKWDCDCKNEKVIVVNTAFLHDIAKTSDLLLHIDVELNNGDFAREELPFRLVDKHN